MNRLLLYTLAGFFVAGCNTRSSVGVAERYGTALLDGDYTSFVALFEHARRSYINADTFPLMEFIAFEITTVSEPHVDIWYKLQMGDQFFEDSGSLYILPCGHIKYDPIFVMHPALALNGLLRKMKDDDADIRRSAEFSLTQWGIPTFDFAHDASSEEREKSVAGFQGWLDLNIATFDLGEVIIPLSPIDLKRVRK